MISRTKRRVRAAIVASALSSSFMLMAMFGLTTMISGCADVTVADTKHPIDAEHQQTTKPQATNDQTAGETAGSTGSGAIALSEMSVSGEITKIKDASITYKDGDAKEHTVMVDDSTTYTLDGQETTFSGLKVGHTISATLTSDGDNAVAKSVVASSRVD